jgi:hypothetical protein
MGEKHSGKHFYCTNVISFQMFPFMPYLNSLFYQAGTALRFQLFEKFHLRLSL